MGGDADNPFLAEEAIVVVQYFCDTSLQAFREDFFDGCGLDRSSVSRYFSHDSINRVFFKF
jgi:hypothetical protein